MAKKNILIVTDDEEYANLIEGELAFSVKNDILINIITDKNYFIEYTKEYISVDVLIIEEHIKSSVYNVHVNDKTIVLGEDGRNGCINKYDGVEFILTELGREYISDGDKIQNINKTKIICTMSACGGCGKTFNTLSLCDKLANEEKKVLYVDAENVQNFDELLDEKDIKKAENKLAIELSVGNFENSESIFGHGRFDYLPQFSGALSMYQLSISNIFDFVSRISLMHIYDYIVVELESGFRDNFNMFLNMASFIVLYSLQSKIGATRAEKMLVIISEYDAEKFIVCGRYDSSKEDFLSERLEKIGKYLCDKVEEGERIEMAAQKLAISILMS